MRTPYLFSDWKAGTLPPKGWDGADALDDGWTVANIEAFMRATVAPWVPPSPEKPKETPSAPAGGNVTQLPAPPVREARPLQQEKPATITKLSTGATYAGDEGWMIDLVTNTDGKLKPGATKNWALFLEHHPDMVGVLAWDAFKVRATLMRAPPWADEGASWKPRVLTDHDYSEAVMWLEALHLTPKQTNIIPVINAVAKHHTFDRLTEYLEGLVWDGKPRVETFASYYLGVEDTPYARTVSKRWLISAVARGLQAGCKVDTMPILEGTQGARKSTALRNLFGDEFFTDELSDIATKDAMMEMQGVWGIEVAEMHRISAAGADNVKKFLSRQIDRYRPPYGQNVIEAPRRIILNGTINPEGNAYLRDVTGARRFWPLEVGRIDLAAISNDRDQIWAEAVALFRAGVEWWVQDDEQAAVEVEQEKRSDVDAWVDVIAPMLKHPKSITQVEIFKGIGLLTKDIEYRHAARVGRIMKKLGWLHRRDRSDGEDRIVFYDPAKDQPQEAGEW